MSLRLSGARGGALSPADAGAEADLVGRVRDRLLEDAGSTSPTSSRLAAAVRAEGRVLGDQAILATLGLLRAELEGAGPLSAVLTDPSVTDVLVNGPHDVWVDQGAGLIRTGVRFTSEAAVRQLAQRLAATAGRRLDDSSPWCDLRLPEGVRLHAVLPPVSRHGTVLSLRVPARRPWTVDELERSGTLGPIGRQLLVDLVDARRSFLVSGGTGTGKTTVLATLLALVAHDERIVLVEDLPELVPDHPHVVSLVGRPANIEGAGEVTVRDLVRQALRMRPDRLVVGECRGAEVVDLLAALNTGHQGGCGTVHANSAVDVPTRLEALGVAAGLSREALHAQLASAVDVVLHLERSASGARVLTEVAVLERDRDGLVVARPALVRESGDLREAAHAGRLVDRLEGAGR